MLSAMLTRYSLSSAPRTTLSTFSAVSSLPSSKSFSTIPAEDSSDSDSSAPAQMRFSKMQHFPAYPINFMSFQPATRTQPHVASFSCDPRMTKHEIAEYLTKIYDLPTPKKVNTAQFHGKRKRISGKRNIVHYKYRDYKKAYVTWDKSPYEKYLQEQTDAEMKEEEAVAVDKV